MNPRTAFTAALAGLLFAVLPMSSPCQQADVGTAELTTLEGRTLRPANSNDLAMLAIWGGNVMRTAGAQGRPTVGGVALFELEPDLELAETLADAVLAEKDPFAGVTGDLHLAHRSPIDDTLQPYRAYIPKGYDSSKTYPLIIGLHGASGDENSFMRRQDFFDEHRTGADAAHD